jgi:hypothetical protein
MTARKCLVLTLFVFGLWMATADGTPAKEDKVELKKGDKASSGRRMGTASRSALPLRRGAGQAPGAVGVGVVVKGDVVWLSAS